MPIVDKFGRIGDPKVHLIQFIALLQLRGLTIPQLTFAFPMTLTGAAFNWIHGQPTIITKDQEEMTQAFIKQYLYNAQLDVTIHDLETTKKNPNKTFAEFQT